MNEVKIEKIVIKIEGLNIELTTDQAEKLARCLDKIFPPEKIKEVIKEYFPIGYPSYPYYPSYHWPDVIYCGNGGTSAQYKGAISNTTYTIS
jgi:hypothetical protein